MVIRLEEWWISRGFVLVVVDRAGSRGGSSVEIHDVEER